MFGQSCLLKQMLQKAHPACSKAHSLHLASSSRDLRGLFLGGSSRGARLVDLVISNGGPGPRNGHESILRRGR